MGRMSNVTPIGDAPKKPLDASVGEEDDKDVLGEWLTASAGKTVSAADVLDQARIEAGLDSEDLDKIPLMDRWDTPNGRWVAFQDPPGGNMADFVVLAIFVGDQSDRLGDHVPGEGRIYVMPRSLAQGADSVCYRYSFSRLPQSGGHRAVMKLRLFIEELAHELDRMAVVFDVIEDSEETDEPE